AGSRRSATRYASPPSPWAVARRSSSITTGAYCPEDRIIGRTDAPSAIDVTPRRRALIRSARVRDEAEGEEGRRALGGADVEGDVGDRIVGEAAGDAGRAQLGGAVARLHAV